MMDRLDSALLTFLCGFVVGAITLCTIEAAMEGSVYSAVVSAIALVIWIVISILAIRKFSRTNVINNIIIQDRRGNTDD